MEMYLNTYIKLRNMPNKGFLFKDTQYFSQFDQILPSRDERNPQNNTDAV